MQALNALKEILIGAIPTFILLWILYLYISKVFYRPLEETLRKRREDTAGLRLTAEAAVAEAETKTASYQAALRSAQSEVYRVQEQERQRALEERAEVVRQARARAEQLIATARQQIHQEAEAAKATLGAEAEQLAASITRAILRPAALAAPAGRSETAP
ncbi:MAG: ATP synthase F0 subunit B [Acidobacteria bacterium]|nr:ATP synthase F0 subunit B [Acidobacteriota bacterium]